MDTLLTPREADSARTNATFRRGRRLAIALSGVTAILYAFIATNVITVLQGPSDEVATAQLAFAAPAAALYVVGMVVLVRSDRRWLWAGGAFLQIAIIGMYFNVAPQRTPPFEVWGIAIRVVQLALTVTLVYLVVRAPLPGGPAQRNR